MEATRQQQHVTDESSTKPEISKIETLEQVVGEQSACRLLALIASSRPTRDCQREQPKAAYPSHNYADCAKIASQEQPDDKTGSQNEGEPGYCLDRR